MAEDDLHQIELDIARYKRDKAVAKLEKARVKLERERSKRASGPGPQTDPPRRGGPRNPDWDTWRKFCADLQRLQALTGKGDDASKADIYTVSGYTERQITYAMKGYQLGPRSDWPPSRWNPNERRIYRSPRHI